MSLIQAFALLLPSAYLMGAAGRKIKSRPFKLFKDLIATLYEGPKWNFLYISGTKIIICPKGNPHLHVAKRKTDICATKSHKGK